MEHSEKVVKGGLIVIFTIISSYFGALALPFALLVIANLADYVTGLMAAKKREQTINSEKGFEGIQKKIGMWLVVVVAVIVDFGMGYAAGQISIQLPISYALGCLVSIWLLFNELISVLENLNDVGVKLPPFLKPIIENMKCQTEDNAKIEKVQEIQDKENK